MNEYVGTVGGKLQTTATLIREHSYDSPFGYRQTVRIYVLEDDDKNTLVWKTSTYLSRDIEQDNGNLIPDTARRGDRVTIKATIKEHSEYHGVPQTVLTRVKVLDIEHAPTKAELDAAKAEEQTASLGDRDWIWCMPYRQYKEHYSDCETIAGSYNPDFRTIKVIIRDGRLVPSGTRGRHFSGYKFRSPDGKQEAGYYAISEETARKRLAREYPDSDDWELVRIYQYNGYWA